MALVDFFKREKRMSTQVPNSYQWFLDSLGNIFGTTSQSGQSVTQKTAISIAAVKKCVDIISNGIVNLNVKVYSDIDGVKKAEPKHAIAILIDEPNTFQTKSQWIEWMVMCQVLKGNGYSQIIRDNNFQPIALMPLITENVKPVIQDGILRYQITNNDQSSFVESYDIIHFKGKCLETPLFGYSPIVYHRETMGVSLAATAGQSSSYKNGVLKFFIKTSGNLNVTQLGDLKTSLNNVIDNKSNSLAVPGGVGVERIQMTPEEAQYILSKKMSAEEIANIFGVPISMVVSGVSGKATVEQEYQEFYSNTLANYAIKNEEELRRKLITKPAEKGVYYFKFNFNSLLRATALDRAEFYNKGINNGWMSPNEARGFEDQNAYEGGDQKFVNANLIPTELMSEWITGKINQLNSAAMVNNNPNGNN